MADQNFSEDFFDELDDIINLDGLENNQRTTVRYRRGDIHTMIQQKGFFVSKRTPVSLIDISSRGAAIECTTKLKINSQLIFILTFNDGIEFKVQSKVVNKISAGRYGLRFAQYQNELAEHLLTTQTDLSFG